MTLKEKLEWRYATKQFDPEKKVPEEDLQDLIDSIRLSPSSYGLQPWHFLVITDPDIRTELKPHCWNQAQVTECSHLFVLCRKNSMDESYIQDFTKHIAEIRGVDEESIAGYKEMMLTGVMGKSEEERNTWMDKQLYIALGFLMFACMENKIDSCPMEGFIKEEVDRILGLSEQGWNSVVLCPVGYRSAEDKYGAIAKVRWKEGDVVERR